MLKCYNTLTPNSTKETFNMKQYKVLSQKDKWFSGKFDPAVLENALNAYAQQGWVVVSAFAAEIPALFNNTREEAIVILEREV